tara:strand:- start:583 stop:876 length:294 start_codon:yes stop_codon:yes gene_type:complete
MQINKPPNPSQNIVDKESEHLLLAFCSYCTLLKGKRLSLQNVFILVLDDKKINQTIKTLLGVDSDYDVVKIFLEYDNSITKSKYVTKYLNLKNKNAN